MSLQNTKIFHETFGHPVLDKPTIPSEERCNLRVDLIQEELNELREAIENKCLVSIADALGDIQVVLDGSFLEFGLGGLKDRILTEIERSNMSKACDTDEEGKVSLKAYEDNGVDCHFRIINDKRVIQRASDDKILKSKFYSKAKLDFVLNAV